VDSDGDGVNDPGDQCPASEVSGTVVLDGCDSGAANVVDADGCTINDQLTELADSTSSQRAYTRAVRRLLRCLTRTGEITPQEETAIRS
jgi:hypothetical protein